MEIPNPISLNIQCPECSEIMKVDESFRSGNYYFTLHHLLGYCTYCKTIQSKSICVDREGYQMDLDGLEAEPEASFS